jgi:hypothetical protein
MKIKHTPAPWNTQSLIVNDSSGTAIAVILNSEIRHENICTIKAESNAKLIAAAPDLLNELVKLVAHIDNYEPYDDIELDAARTAIANATGGAR